MTVSSQDAQDQTPESSRPDAEVPEKSATSQGFGLLSLVAREGGHAPGTPNGVTYFSLRDPVLNAFGQAAFIGQLASTGINSSNNEGIWAEDRAGSLRLIARKGDLLEMSPGVFNTIRSLSFVVNTREDHGRGSGFNDVGQLAFWAEFTDGMQGIFVSDIATIPEPASSLLIATAMVLVMASRAVSVRVQI